MRLICKSRTYQLSVETNKWNADDKTNYSHAMARRLPAEVLLDAVYRVTGSSRSSPGVPAGTRAAALPDSGVELPSGFLTTFGRPARESACECERSSGLQLGPVMALVSGPTLGDAIADPANELTKLVDPRPTTRSWSTSCSSASSTGPRPPPRSSLPRGRSRRSTATTADWPRSSASARPSSP